MLKIVLPRKQINRTLATLLVLLLTLGNITFMPSLYSFAAETDVTIQITSFEPEKEVYETGDVISGTATLTNTTDMAINDKSIAVSISPSVGDASLNFDSGYECSKKAQKIKYIESHILFMKGLAFNED